MARILKDRGMTQTTIGRLALTGAAVADVLAWVMLALVVVLAGSGHDWNAFCAAPSAGWPCCAAVVFVVLSGRCWRGCSRGTRLMAGRRVRCLRGC